MRFLKLFIPLLVLATFVACSGLFNKGSDGPELKLQATQTDSQTTTFNGDTLVFIPIDYREGPIREYDFPEFTSELQDNQIIIHGYYLASSDFMIASSFDYNGKNITINIHMDEDDQFVPSISKGYFYDAYITNLSDGEYSVKIIHENDLLRGKYNESHTIFTKEFVVE